MKILFVHERFGALGGAESNACLTASELRKRGHSVGLVHGPRTGNDEGRWEEVFADRYPLGVGMNSEVIRAALDRFRPDLVYVHKMSELDVIAALVDSGRPLVRMVHDHDIYCMKSYKYAYLSRRICQRAVSPYCIFPCGAFLARNRQGRFPIRFVSYSQKKQEVELNRQFHRMVVVSQYMREELLRNGFAPHRIEVHPPVPRTLHEPMKSSFSNRNLVLFAGQIIRGKGVDVLLRALAQVRSRFECVILGEGNHRRHCEKLAIKFGLSERVSFRGFVPQDELQEYYRECSLVTVSSVWPEPIATIGLEAMRFALPVVAFDAGGIKDWLHDGENGFLVPWMDHIQFARRIETLLEDKALARRMGERGLRLADERFNFEGYITNLEAMFSRLLQEARNGNQAHAQSGA